MRKNKAETVAITKDVMGKDADITSRTYDELMSMFSDDGRFNPAALVTLARRHGLVRLEAEVLSVNAPMLAVFQRSGLPLRQRRESGVIHLDLDLAPPPG
jgi:hypothetical protein